MTALAIAAGPHPAIAHPQLGVDEASSRPAYQKLRYDEDYSYLRDPSRRTDSWDPIKYIPLNPSGAAYLSLGGEGRWRYERYDHYQWDPDAPDDDGYLLQRYLLHGDLHLSPAFRLFGQLQSSLERWRSGGARPTDEDRLDVHQLFGDARLALDPKGEAAITLRLGRQEMLYGSQRLVSVRESPNIRRAFDAARLLTRFGRWSVDGFFARPVNEDPGVFDDGRGIHGNDFWGLYATRAAPGGPGLDLYYLGLNSPDAEFAQGSGDAKRHSIGARLFGEGAGWDYNFEGLFQFGRFADDHIVAWTLASDSGYTFAAPFSPRVGLKAGVISGDSDPNDDELGTFDPLFPRGAYFGEASLVWPANLLDVDPSIEVQLTSHVAVQADWDIFWRYSTDDGLYTNGGRVARPVDGEARFIGHQTSVGIEWRPERHVTVDVTYSHFFAGEFIRESGPDTDVDFFAAWLIYRL